MRLIVEVYIDDQRLDLFTDESIEINRTIKDFRELDKVFTDYTQSFTIPASKNNNIAMSHWYDESIATGFNPATKKAARIDINTLPFRFGYMWLNRAVLKNGSVDYYEVAFFSQITNLSDFFGKDTLSQLGSVSGAHMGYNDFSDAIKGTVGTDHIIPMATSQRNWNLQGRGNGIYNSINNNPYKSSVGVNNDRTLQAYEVNTEHENYDFANNWFIQDGNTGGGADTFLIYIVVANQAVDWTIKAYDAYDGFAYLDGTQDSGTGNDVLSIQVTRSITAAQAIAWQFSDVPQCDFKVYISVALNAANELVTAKYQYASQGGLMYELKPALKADRILTEIENKYSISFTGGFWSKDAWQDLFVWSNRAEGFGDHYTMEYTQIINGTQVSPQSGSTQYNPTTGVLTVPANSGTKTVTVALTVQQSIIDQVNDSLPTPKLKLVAYDIISSSVFQIVYFPEGREGVIEFSFPDSAAQRQIKFYVKSNFPEKFNWTIASATSQFNFIYQDELVELDTSSTCEFRYFNHSYTDSLTGETLTVEGGIPDQNIFEWLSGIIKMFNLIILPIDSTTFQVETFDDWKALGNDVDITKHVDLDNVEVQPAELFKQLKFAYQPTESVIGQNFSQQNGGIGYGDSVTEIRDAYGDAISSNNFELTTIFENPSWSRLTNFAPETSNNEILSKLMVCHYIDKDLSTIGGAPVMFYKAGVQDLLPDDETLFSFRNFYTSEVTSGANAFNRYNVCFQYNGMGSSFTNSLNFGAEVNPFTLVTDTPTSPSIYKYFWEDWITELYDLSMRRTMLRAILPLHLMLEIKVNDVLIIRTNRYTINNMRLNLTTGEANFELLTLVD